MIIDRHRDGQGQRTKPAPVVGDWLAEGESALDLAAAALTRGGELDESWPETFAADRRTLRGKLEMLLGMINGHADTTRASRAWTVRLLPPAAG